MTSAHSSNPLRGKLAVITGAAGGIGLLAFLPGLRERNAGSFPST